MAHRAQLRTASTLLACAVLFRAVPFMWTSTTTVTAGTLLLLAVNLAVVFVLPRVLIRDAGLPAWLASIAALPLALPAIPVAEHSIGATGSTAALWLYTLLLWVLRERPFAFGTLLGLGMLHQSFSACAPAALVVMDAIGLMSAPARRLYFEDRARHWALVVVAWVALSAAAATIQSFASGWGPVDALSGALCFAPETWTERSRLLVGDHLPRLFGGIGVAPVDSDVQAAVSTGQAGIPALVGVITLTGLAAGTWFWWSQRRAKDAGPISHVGGYLVLVGTVSTVVYGYLSCANISVETLHDNLLAVFVPVGALVMALQALRTTTPRAVLATAVVVWCAANALGMREIVKAWPARPALLSIRANRHAPDGVSLSSHSARDHMPEVDEQARLTALRSYKILDTEPEAAFDDLTLLASQICGTPMALITLIDEDRQWFKSERGIGVRETERSVAFCTHAIKQPGRIMEVPDTREDDRFRENPFVTGQPHIRFYAGAPLVTPDGYALGTLCVVDTEPRRLTAEQMEALSALRHQAQAQLELRRRLADLRQALAERDKAEAEQKALIAELRSSLEKVDKLTALMPYTSTCEMNIVVPAEPESIPKVSEGIRQLLQGKGWTEEEVMPVELALDEAMANAIRHGCKNDPTKQVQCIVTTDDHGELLVAVRDPGPGFEPAKVPNPLEGENVFKGSGRGVFLINQLMDEVGFADGGREVQMKKRRAEQPERALRQ